jgi:hypothetical protein
LKHGVITNNLRLMIALDGREINDPITPIPLTAGGAAVGMTFHHFGLLSAQPEATRVFLVEMGYTVMDPVIDPLQNVRLHWASHPAFPAIEIISPTDTPGAVSKLLKSIKHGVYHLCFEVTDPAATLARLGVNRRVVLVSDSKPAPLFKGRHVSFHFIENFGLIELLEPGNPGAAADA